MLSYNYNHQILQVKIGVGIMLDKTNVKLTNQNIRSKLKKVKPLQSVLISTKA